MIYDIADAIREISRGIKEFCESFGWLHGFIIPHNGRRHQDKQTESYGHVGREFKLRSFSAGSILTLRNRIKPPASTTSVERTPWKMQSTKLTPSMTAPR